LYKHAKGSILIGIDDDAHPLNPDFIEKTNYIFKRNINVAIIAFEEIRGVFPADKEALKKGIQEDKEYLCGGFVGCGFAIKKSAYFQTQGFPTWIDIYGEESCVAIQILNLGFDILFSNQIKVNHRVNNLERISQGKNYFRFGKQLKNETFFYVVYYPKPVIKIIKLYWHNFQKYAISDRKYFYIYFKTIVKVIIKMPTILKFRNPVNKETITKRENY
jgi:GT2 family glycosyltransferase